jgi:hypothetical protein
MTVDHLLQNSVINNSKIPEDRTQRGSLVKSAIRKGHRGCETLLSCLETQQKETFEKAMKVWTDRKKSGKCYKNLLCIFFSLDTKANSIAFLS